MEAVGWAAGFGPSGLRSGIENSPVKKWAAPLLSWSNARVWDSVKRWNGVGSLFATAIFTVLYPIAGLVTENPSGCENLFGHAGL